MVQATVVVLGFWNATPSYVLLTYTVREAIGTLALISDQGGNVWRRVAAVARAEGKSADGDRVAHGEGEKGDVPHSSSASTV